MSPEVRFRVQWPWWSWEDCFQLRYLTWWWYLVCMTWWPGRNNFLISWMENPELKFGVFYFWDYLLQLPISFHYFFLFFLLYLCTIMNCWIKFIIILSYLFHRNSYSNLSKILIYNTSKVWTIFWFFTHIKIKCSSHCRL